MEFTNDQKKPFLSKGKIVEKEFSKLFNDPKFSTSTEDQLEHWDIKIETKIDVKGLKKINRSNDEVNEHIHWLEIKGIIGKNGWCYGDAEYFCFELKSYWVVVAKEDIQNFIKDNVIKEYTEKPTLYKLYQRQGRKDVLTMVTSYDLCYISSYMHKKM